MQAAMGLRHLHEQGLVHGDFNTGNWFIERIEGNGGRVEYRLILGDFGESKETANANARVRV